jgi:hypothetical protein
MVGTLAVLSAAVLGVTATSVGVNASGPHPAAAGQYTLVTNFGAYLNYQDNAGTIHWNTPNPGPGKVTSASVTRPGNVLQVWNGVNGAGLIATCPNGLHWVSNSQRLVISSCATVTTTTTSTTSSTSSTTSTSSTVTSTTLESTTTTTEAGATTTGGQSSTTSPGTGTVTQPIAESTTTAAGSGGGTTATSAASGGPVPTAPGGLPSTGSTSVPFVLLALGVLLAGLGLRLLGRST